MFSAFLKSHIDLGACDLTLMGDNWQEWVSCLHDSVRLHCAAYLLVAEATAQFSQRGELPEQWETSYRPLLPLIEGWAKPKAVTFFFILNFFFFLSHFIEFKK